MTRHELDWVSLLGGALFLSLGAVFLFEALGTWSAGIAWVPPVVLIVFGLAGVLSTLARHRQTAAAPTLVPATAPTPAGFGQETPENGGQLPEPGDGAS